MVEHTSYYALRRCPGAAAEAWWVTASQRRDTPPAIQALLARVVDPERYPLAARVGAAAGEAHGSTYDPAQAYEFGLERVLDGLAALIDR